MTSVAGLNLKGRIWRLLQGPDDDVGGSVPTGMILYEPVFSRIRAEQPTLAILEQGLETEKIFSGMLSYVAYSPTGTFDVQENDQYEITHPVISAYYGKKFVIIGIQRTSFMDSRQFLICTMRRLEVSNSNNLQ